MINTDYLSFLITKEINSKEKDIWYPIDDLDNKKDVDKEFKDKLKKIY